MGFANGERLYEMRDRAANAAPALDRTRCGDAEVEAKYWALNDYAVFGRMEQQASRDRFGNNEGL